MGNVVINPYDVHSFKEKQLSNTIYFMLFNIIGTGKLNINIKGLNKYFIATVFLS